VNPVGLATVCRVCGAGTSENDNRHTISHRIVESHGGVLDSDEVMQEGHGWTTGCLAIAMRHRDRDFFMRDENDLRLVVFGVVDQ